MVLIKYLELTPATEQIEELKSSPDTAEGSAPELVAQELDRDLNGPAAAKSQPNQINDLTSMVVKKKKPAPDGTAEKRKAEDDVEGSPEKKVKVDAATA